MHEDHEELSTPEDERPVGTALSEGPLVKDVNNLTDPRNGTCEYSTPKASYCPLIEKHSTDPPGNHFNEEEYDVNNPSEKVSSWQPGPENGFSVSEGKQIPERSIIGIIVC